MKNNLKKHFCKSAAHAPRLTVLAAILLGLGAYGYHVRHPSNESAQIQAIQSQLERINPEDSATNPEGVITALPLIAPQGLRSADEKPTSENETDADDAASTTSDNISSQIAQSIAISLPPDDESVEDSDLGAAMIALTKEKNLAAAETAAPGTSQDETESATYLTEIENDAKDLLTIIDKVESMTEDAKSKIEAMTELQSSAVKARPTGLPVIISAILDWPNDDVLASFDAASDLKGWILVANGAVDDPQIAYVTPDENSMFIGSLIAIENDAPVNLTGRYLEQFLATYRAGKEAEQTDLSR